MSALDWQNISKAADIIRNGQLVAVPTETVYGLAGDATNDRAVAKIFEAKGRPSFNPLISHIADLDMAKSLAEFSDLAESLATALWPGPLTLVLPRRQNCPVSKLACAGLDTIALRQPKHPITLALIKSLGRPLAAPSANPSGQISPTIADHVRAGLGSKVDLILDGGPCNIGVESAIVKISGNDVVLLRPGGISREELQKCIGRPISLLEHSQPDGTAIEAPGMLTSHYAPNAKVRLDVITPQEDEAFLAFGDSPLHDHKLNLSPSRDLTEAAANLFSMLHTLDNLCKEKNIHKIAVSPIPKNGLGDAINDRLRRAAATEK